MLTRDESWDDTVLSNRVRFTVNHQAYYLGTYLLGTGHNRCRCAPDTLTRQAHKTETYMTYTAHIYMHTLLKDSMVWVGWYWMDRASGMAELTFDTRSMWVLLDLVVTIMSGWTKNKNGWVVHWLGIILMWARVRRGWLFRWMATSWWLRANPSIKV